jgi:AraC-like DNA-binding protein
MSASATEVWIETGSVRFGGLCLSQVCRVRQAVHRAAQVAWYTRPDGYHLVVSLCDGVLPGPSGCPLSAGGMLLYDTPGAADLLGVLAAAEAGHRSDDRVTQPADAVVLDIPRDRLPVPAARMEHLLGIGMAGGFGVGAVLVGNLKQMITLANPISEHGANAVAGVVLDLLGAVLEERIGVPSRLDVRRNNALLIGVRAFVEQRLSDPNLSLSQVAAAHHVSLRSLHKLFERSGTTAAAWIRHRRLEHCRLDLANPDLGRLPVHSIARRWGFVNDSHFNRAFRARFGLSPAAYRSRTQ